MIPLFFPSLVVPGPQLLYYYTPQGGMWTPESPLGAVSAALWQRSDAGCDWLWWQGGVGQQPQHHRRPDLLSEKPPWSTKYSLGTLHSRSSSLFPAVRCFIFRWAVAVLAQFILICEKISPYTHTHTHIWAEAPTEAAWLGKLWQHCLLWERCKK